VKLEMIIVDEILILEVVVKMIIQILDEKIIDE